MWIKNFLDSECASSDSLADDMIDGDVERDDRDFIRLKIHLFNAFLVENSCLLIFKNTEIIGLYHDSGQK